MNDAEIERLAAEYIAEDWGPDRYYREMNVIAFATKLLEHGYGEGRKDEREASMPEWFALVMGAAASIEDAANCLRDSDAKKQADGAAKHYRDAANAIWSNYWDEQYKQQPKPSP